MVTIDFVEEAPIGVENRILQLVIPNAGELPPVPHEWGGNTAHRSRLTSGAWRTWPGGRQYITVETGSVTLIWIQERSEWIAYREHRDRLPTGGCYSDEQLTIEGPWKLDFSYEGALATAFPRASGIPGKTLVKTSPETLEAP